jgi:glycosidase
MWRHYRQLIALRKQHAALARGGYRSLDVSGAGAGNAIAYERYLDDERIVVVANFSDVASEDLTIALPDPGDGEVRVLFGEGGEGDLSADGLVVARVGPRDVIVYRL